MVSPGKVTMGVPAHSTSMPVVWPLHRGVSRQTSANWPRRTCSSWREKEKLEMSSQLEVQLSHAVILTHLMNLLQKVESEMGCPDWHTVMHSLRLQDLLWIYCPGHAGVSGNRRADKLASTADITAGLQLGRAEVLRGLRNFLKMDRLKHHSIDCLKDRGVEKRSGRYSNLRGQERSVFNQTNIGTVSRATFGRLLRDGAECVWAFPSVMIPSWAEIETAPKSLSHA